MIPDQNVLEPISLSMAPYAGPWTQAEAAHLLRRTVFGLTMPMLNNAVTLGMDATVTQLLQAPTLDLPLAYNANDAIVSEGNTWVGAVCPVDQIQIANTENARRESMAAWHMKRINTQSMSIHEKMCLFWQNHFAAESTFDMRATYNYMNLISNNS
jgi:uncharacterized protein (DUF1800 family)